MHLIVVSGLQRAGNDGVMNWISGVFDQVLLENNQPHDILRDAAFVRALTARLGGRFSDAGLRQVTGQGGGSSFDGKPRKSYAALVRAPWRLRNPKLWARVLRRPWHYLRRWSTPPFDASQLRTDERYKHLAALPGGEAVLQDEDVARQAKLIFGLDRPDVMG